MRIFTPAFEMPFAGHPTLGTAHVVRALKGGDEIALEMRAGVIPVRGAGDRWTLQANAPRTRAVTASHEELASMLALEPADIASRPLWDPLWSSNRLGSVHMAVNDGFPIKPPSGVAEGLFLDH